MSSVNGVLLVDKPRGRNSFALVAVLRRLLGVQKIGHTGTLDPFATGVMVMLIGRQFTRLSDKFLSADKEYIAEVRLGISTDTFDCDGKILSESTFIPSEEQVINAVSQFQGEIDQVPPMFSAKKQNGKKLYELARQGKTVERLPVRIRVETQLLSYQYPDIKLSISCSKGTYIRSIANDIGLLLTCGAHVTDLRRVRSGYFHLKDCYDGGLLFSPDVDMVALRRRIDENLGIT